MDFSNAHARLRMGLSDFPQLAFTQSEGDLQIGTGEVPNLLSLSQSSDSTWVVYSNDGHVHVAGIDEAISQLRRLLDGTDRFTKEFRGDKMVANWREAWDGEAFEADDMSIYVSLIDDDEWRLSDGEEWRQVRTTLSIVDGQFKRVSQELIVESPLSKPIGWMKKMLGKAQPGLKWTVGMHAPSFFYLAPTGWREVHAGDGFRDLAGSNRPSVLLRSRTYFREAELPTSQRLTGLIPSSSITYSEEEAEGGWNKSSWTLIFSDGETDMMGILELYSRPEAEASARSVRGLLTSSVSKAVYFPPNG